MGDFNLALVGHNRLCHFCPIVRRTKGHLLTPGLRPMDANVLHVYAPIALRRSQPQILPRSSVPSCPFKRTNATRLKQVTLPTSPALQTPERLYVAPRCGDPRRTFVLMPSRAVQ